MNKAVNIIFSGLMLLSFLAAGACAQEGTTLGNATVYTSLTMEEQYDNNVFLESSDEKDDFINIITPDFRVEAPFGSRGKHNAQLGYKAVIGSYADYDAQNYVNQDVMADVKLELPRGSWSFSNIYRDTNDRADTEFTELIDRFENTFATKVSIEMNRFSYEVGYSNFSRDYDESDFANVEFTQDTATATAFYQAFPKTKLLLEYSHAEIDYENDNTRDGDYDAVNVGLKGELTGKTVGIVKIGYQDRQYDGVGEKGFDSGVAEIGLISDIDDLTSLKVSFIRSAYESTFGTNNFYESDRTVAEISRELGGRLTGIGKFSFENNKYPEDTTYGSETKKPDDDLWTAEVGLEYELKEYMKAKLSYQYKERDSNFNGRDYKRDLISLSFNLLM